MHWLHDKQVSNIQKYFQKKHKISELHRSIVEADKEVTTARLRKQDQDTGEQRRKDEYNADLKETRKEKVLHRLVRPSWRTAKSIKRQQ